jgi:hypothetical protein
VLAGRVAPGYCPVGADSTNTNDCNGHGTHTAATVGGATFGVAKAVTLVPVRVLNCDGGGSIQSLVEGIDWMTQQVHAYREAHGGAGAFVANLSLGQGGSPAIDAAVTNAIQAEHVTFVVAAGNENESACNPSPARVPAAITVGAITREDERPTFSNWGKCVDVWAPGFQVTSAWSGSDTATSVESGTSMAAPHVAGAAALYLERFPAATPKQVADAISASATTGLLKNLGSGSPNKLLFTPALGGLANRGPTMGAPAPFLINGQSTSRGAVPVKVVANAPVDPEGNAVTATEMQMSRDGGATWSAIDLPSAKATTATVTVPATAALRFRARATDSLGNVGPWTNGPVRSLTVRDQDTSAAYTKAGRWRLASTKGALGQSLRRTSKKGAAVSFSFRGTQFAWIARMSANCGKALVLIDGKKITGIDLFSRGATARRSVFYATGLSSGKHKVKIVVQGKGRKAARGHQINVDGWATMS